MRENDVWFYGDTAYVLTKEYHGMDFMGKWKDIDEWVGWGWEIVSGKEPRRVCISGKFLVENGVKAVIERKKK